MSEKIYLKVDTRNSQKIERVFLANCVNFYSKLLSPKTTTEMTYYYLANSPFENYLSMRPTEKFMCHTELKNLGRVLGQSGISHLNVKLAQEVACSVSKLKEMITGNKQTWESLQINQTSGKFFEILKKNKNLLKDIRLLIISSGAIINFRDLLSSTLTTNFFQTRFEEYLKQSIKNEEVLNMFENVNSFDICMFNEFRQIIGAPVTDLHTWSILPFIYAMICVVQREETLTFDAIEDTRYNASLIAQSFETLTTYLIAVTYDMLGFNTAQIDPTTFISKVHLDFLNMIATIALFNENVSQKDILGSKQLETALLVLRKLTTLSKFISLDDVERVFPPSIEQAILSNLQNNRLTTERHQTKRENKEPIGRHTNSVDDEL
ncbi:hypothetical protein BJ742DRAFT_420764 [Cladochytrium replicatum]|nr:hypothetical protein BJ742DRAFT_420764 [Cladochytrium replicatum]